MKSWLKENWFRAGLLILIAAAIIIAAFIILKIKKDDNVLAQQEFAVEQAQALKQIQASSTLSIISSSSASNGNNTSAQTDTPEDSTLKIARCKSDATIESNLEKGRAGDPMDLTTCAVNPQCNMQSFSSVVEESADNIGETSYDNVYNLCLQTSESQFDSVEQIYDGYWDQCIAENPTPNDSDTSGIEGINLYNTQKNCVSNLVSTRGL